MGTLYLPLDPSSVVPPQPSFLIPPTDPAVQLGRTIQAIMKAKRIVVICGAGISVQAGIPDFRSSEGLFHTIKRDNPREAMSSGKELFDVSVFNSEQKTSLFCQMIAQLSDLSQAAEPTAFHHVLRALDDRGRLLRVYTQNIDAIEQKSGLSFGVPEFEGKRAGKRAKGKGKVSVQESDATQQQQQQEQEETGQPEPVASTSRLSSPFPTPRCIPLHGTLQSLHCQTCNHSSPLLPYLSSLSSGIPPPCPECTSLEATRQLVGKRPRGIGRMRPSVVLYNEAHRDGEGVGDVVQKDLMGRRGKGKGKGGWGQGADLLLVVGTSLRVSGTKRMVREFAKAVKARGAASSSNSSPSSSPKDDSNSNGGLATPAPSPRPSPTAAGDEEAPPPKAIYLNLDFPVPTREWEGVFDAWIQGDAQAFADVLKAEIDKEKRAKEAASERKRRKEAEVVGAEHEMPDLARMAAQNEKESVKRKLGGSLQSPSSGKRRKSATVVQRPLSPPYTPPSPSLQRQHHSQSPSPSPDDEELLERAKYRLRIPPFHTRPRPYYIPEVYITTRPPPQYVRPYEIEHMSRRRSVTFTPSPPPMDVDIDVDVGMHEGHNRMLSHTHSHQHQPQFNKRTKAGRRAARAAQDERRRSRSAVSNEHPRQRQLQCLSSSSSSSRPRHAHGPTPPPPTHTQSRNGRIDFNENYYSQGHDHVPSHMVRTLQLGIRDSA